jgi:PilZ domain
MFGHKGANAKALKPLSEEPLIRPMTYRERRKWPRLPLAIPVFVRSQDDKGKEFLEFATALNISAGGVLVAVRRSLPPSARILLEIPSAPLAATAKLPKASRTLRAKCVRVTHAEGYHLVGLKFSKPLVDTADTAHEQPAIRRKDTSARVKRFSLSPVVV